MDETTVNTPALVFDDVLPDPDMYRRRALTQRFSTIVDGPVMFHGMAPCADPAIPMKIVATFPNLVPTLSFFRRSPEGQEEPHYIHDDRSMGEWSAVYYLSPAPPEGDGTAFYRHIASGQIEGHTAPGSPEWQREAAAWFDQSQWERWLFVPARFNRLVLFKSSLFHSRAIPENYGAGDDARLIQVCFGTGAFV